MSQTNISQNSDSNASANVSGSRRVLRRSRRRLGRGLLIVIAVCCVAWYFGRPYMLVRQARSLLTTNPRQAAELLEDVVASSGDSFPDAQVLWSRALLRCGRWEEALGCFSQIKNPEAADSASLLELADEAGASKIMLFEVMALEAISPNDSRRADAIDRLISIHEQAGDHAGTIKLANELAELQPANAKPWLVLARTHEQLMSLPLAVSNYRIALNCDQSQSEPISTLRAIVRLLILLGERAEARLLQNQLIQLGESLSLPDQINEARLLRLEGNLDGAWDATAKILTQEHDDPDALELRATISMDRQEYAAAESDLQAIITRQPWNKQAHYKLAQSLSKLGQEKMAAVHFAENRRLLDLANRILNLQGKADRDEAETAELIKALEQVGMKLIAERLKQQSRGNAPTQSLRP